ncbi:MAG: peptidase M50 [Betaproteobacteria bacterium]
MGLGLVVVSGPLLSEAWYRVAELRPRLRMHVRVHRQRYRDQVWYHLTSGTSGQRHRLNQSAYRFVGRLDGRRTVGEIWGDLVGAHRDQALTQDEAIRLLGQLNVAELLQCEMTPDIERVFRQHRTRMRRKRWLELNPLAVRVRLFDPTRQLAVFDRWLTALFSRAALALWIAAVVPALLLAIIHGAELWGYGALHIDTPRYLLIGWIAYPLVKAVHELGHALAIRRWGGAVHDVGITLFAIVPVPYVDASAADSFTQRSQRAVVSAIGILVELFIAALALYVWLSVEAGWVRDIAFVVMLIASVSTVLFNGNPLLRFDGYHLLCDLLDLPNLDSRSRAWWRGVIQRRLFRFETTALPLARGERKWVVLYAPLAWAYRLYIGLLIVLWMAAKSAAIALVIAAALIVTLIVVPCAAFVRAVLRYPRETERRRGKWVLAGTCAGVVAGIALVPLPYATVAPAVVWLPEHAQVRAETEGFVRELRVRNGDIVAPGQLLAMLDDPALMASHGEAQARLLALQVRQYHALQADRSQALSVAEALAHAHAELARIETRIAQLQVRSQAPGRVVFEREEDLAGRYLKKGQTLAYVLEPADRVVRTAARHADAALIRERSRAATVWIEDSAGIVVPGRTTRDIPAATFQLPSPALSERNGGTIATDPSDGQHTQALEPIVIVDVAVPYDTVPRIGGRAWVRFDLGHAPLAMQWTLALRQLLLRHFDATV